MRSVRLEELCTDFPRLAFALFKDVQFRRGEIVREIGRALCLFGLASCGFLFLETADERGAAEEFEH